MSRALELGPENGMNMLRTLRARKYFVTPLAELALTNSEDDPREDGPLAWQDRALCAQTDPETFFPNKGEPTREAKKVCLSCDVRSECLAYALNNEEKFGVWGGLSERERRRLKKNTA